MRQRKAPLPTHQSRFACEPLEDRRLFSAATFQTLLNFDGSNGASPAAGVTVSGSTLYGLDNLNDGQVYSLPASGGSPTVLATLNGTDGSAPQAQPILVGSTLYGGAITGGGSGSDGTIFSVPTGGGTPTKLTNLTLSTGINPISFVVSGNTLYADLAAGGAYASQFAGNGNGTIISVPLSGGSPTVLTSFDGTDGASPIGNLVLVGSTIYGTNSQGTDSSGDVFSLPITGGTPTVLATFNDGVLGHPDYLVVSGNTIYGTLASGGPDGYGAVFSIPIGGGTPTVLAQFNGTNGDEPIGLALVGNTLYGTCMYGGNDFSASETGFGTVFSVPVTGGTPTVVEAFTGSNGDEPTAHLAVSGSTLYGTTVYGGPAFSMVSGQLGNGTVFSINAGSGSTSPALVFSTQPVTAATGATLAPITVSIENSSGAVNTADNSNVTLTLSSGTLSGTTTVAAVNGVATFSNLSIAGAGTYTLTATDGSNTAATSASFTISSGGVTTTSPATTSTLTSSANVFTVGQSCQLSCTVAPTDGSTVAPTGTITFYEDGVAKNTETLGANGTLTVTWTAFDAGPTTQVNFVYSGDSNYTSSTSNTLTQSYLPLSQLGASINNAVIPSSSVPGQPFKAKVPTTFTNTGGVLAGTYTAVLYADMSSNGLTGNQVTLQTVAKHETLKAGKKFAVTLSTKSLPASLPAGTYHLLVEITDPSGNNNLVNTSQTIDVAAPFVALSATVSAVKPASLAVNKTGTVIVTVADTGNVNAVGSLVITLSPSLDGASAISGATLLATPAKRVTIKTIKPGRYILHFKITDSLTAGTYYPIAAVSLDGGSTTAAGTAFTIG